MPGGDGTGPMGMGPMTGRAAGYCAGYGVPGFMNPVPVFGRGRGFGGGGRRGRRNMFWATGLPGWARFGWGAAPPMSGVQPVPNPAAEKEFLTRQADVLQAQLDDLRKRIDELAAEEKVS